MYDLACPIIDHIDGVTHALRANEYYARHEQYQWFLQKLGMPKIEIFDFSRIDFVYTVLSKRKLKYLVENGVVSGWDDPRFPTVRGELEVTCSRGGWPADDQASARAA
jgi:glutamyl-tRNA synthetase